MPEADPTEERLALSRVIQEMNPITSREDGAPVAAVLIGWTLIAEWMDEKGERWLSANASDAAGRRPPSWVSNGHMFEMLHGDWPE